MDGFLLVDKPEGITSFYCLKILRRISGVRKIGFAGTLDPLATGLMIFAFGEATKLIPYLEKSDKVYDVTIRLGAVSDTYDAKGTITGVLPEGSGIPANIKNRSSIEKILEDDFMGEREQAPPAYSAIHIDGKRAYDLARKGEKVVMKKRPVHFYDIRIRSFSWPLLKLTVHCGSGTYIRSLAHDLGQVLECGGYVEELRRVKIALHSIKTAVPLDGLDPVALKKSIIPPQIFFGEWRMMDLSDSDYRILANGGFIENPGLESAVKEGVVFPIMALYRGKCAGVLGLHDGKLKFSRKFNIV